MVDPGLHIIFDSQDGVAEIEYVFLASSFCNSLTNHLYSVGAVHELYFINSPSCARDLGEGQTSLAQRLPPC